MKIRTATIFLLVLASFLVSAAAYNYLPSEMITHWGASGEPNGYMPKEVALLFVPVLGAIITTVLFFVPRLDPLKKNIEKFKAQYELFIVSFAAFFLYIHIITIVINMGWSIDLMQAMSIGFAALFYSLGALVGAAKRNYFIGIRTPWTLSNDKVWDKTHKLGGKLFKVCAIISLFGAAFSEVAFLITIGAIIITAIFLVCYSYFEYRKLGEKEKRLFSNNPPLRKKKSVKNKK